MMGPITLPSNPSSMVAPAVVLFDDVIANAPPFCSYALVNTANKQCSVAYTYVTHISLAEVRTALPSSPYVTQLVESLSDGGELLDRECHVAGFLSTICTAIEYAHRGELPRLGTRGGGSCEQRGSCSSTERR